MTLMKSLMGAAAAVALTAGAALAEPALIFDLGGKFDKSFNEAAHNGAQRWAEQTGKTYREIELQSEAQREQALRRFAEAGSNPIITMGFAMADPLAAVAGDYPNTKFVAVDVNWLDAPNIRQVSFAEHEGLVSGWHDGCYGLEERYRWFHRRHGHPADPSLWLRLCAGCQSCEP